MATDGYTILAQLAIDNDAQIIFDIAANHGQIVNNIRDMPWFLDAIAQELSECETLQDAEDLASTI